MSNYHVLNGLGDGRTYRIAFHVPVPDETNRAGVKMRTAIQQDPARNQESKVPWVDAGEQTQLDAGEFVEIVKPYRRKAGATVMEDRDLLDALYTATVPSVQEELRQEYQYWGFDRDIP